MSRLELQLALEQVKASACGVTFEEWCEVRGFPAPDVLSLTAQIANEATARFADEAIDVAAMMGIQFGWELHGESMSRVHVGT